MNEDQPNSMRAICWLEQCSDIERRECLTAAFRMWPDLMIDIATYLGYRGVRAQKTKHVVGILPDGEEIVIYE